MPKRMRQLSVTVTFQPNMRLLFECSIAKDQLQFAKFEAEYSGRFRRHHSTEIGSKLIDVEFGRAVLRMQRRLLL